MAYLRFTSRFGSMLRYVSISQPARASEDSFFVLLVSMPNGPRHPRIERGTRCILNYARFSSPDV